jgi:hypothetical protein
MVDSCTPGAASAETCNGVDDDCDGIVDNSVASTPTTCGTGACSAAGQASCQNGSIVDSCTPGAPSPETCNGVDDDCDGAIDEGGVCALDSDRDGIPDATDNCPTVTNRNQNDKDGDGIGDRCDPNDLDGPTGDLDHDGIANNVDNCPTVKNRDQEDTDGDGIGDACDAQTGPPTSQAQCDKGGWQAFNSPVAFRNRRECVAFVGASP